LWPLAQSPANSGKPQNFLPEREETHRAFKRLLTQNRGKREALNRELREATEESAINFSDNNGRKKTPGINDDMKPHMHLTVQATDPGVIDGIQPHMHLTQQANVGT
jgi:hypothetical protein